MPRGGPRGSRKSSRVRLRALRRPRALRPATRGSRTRPARVDPAISYLLEQDRGTVDRAVGEAIDQPVKFGLGHRKSVDAVSARETPRGLVVAQDFGDPTEVKPGLLGSISRTVRPSFCACSNLFRRVAAARDRSRWTCSWACSKSAWAFRTAARAFRFGSASMAGDYVSPSTRMVVSAAGSATSGSSVSRTSLEAGTPSPSASCQRTRRLISRSPLSVSPR
jgi:hypothetical protein